MWRGGVHWAADLRYYLDVFPPLALAAAVGAAALRPAARNAVFAALALTAIPLGAVHSVEVARLSHASNAASEQKMPLLKPILAGFE